jgi:hypothetical protein
VRPNASENSQISPSTSVRVVSKVAAAVHTLRLPCRKVEKTSIFAPVWESSGESRLEGLGKMYKPFTTSLRFKSRKVARSFVLTVLSVVVLAVISDKGWSQQNPQIRTAQRLNRHNPTQQEKPQQEKPQQEKPIIASTPALDPASPLGQALASCDKITEEPGSFALPGLKGDVALDRCYKGRDHLVCVFDVLISEAKSLMDSYTKIVDAKYPELNSVDNICKLKRDSLASDITGAEDFTKRFAAFKSQYESGSKCAANVKQAFQGVVLTDMAQPPELLKSMTDSIDGDINKVSEVQKQIVDLAEKMQASTKAMKTIQKIHRTLCVKDKTG